MSNADSANAFSRELADWLTRQVPGVVAAVHRKMTLDGLARIVRRTPVDTGRARGNWQTTVGAGATGTVELLDKGGSAAIEAGARAVEGLQPYSVTFIQNNLPYIERLEDGWSKQAPQGMVGLTLAELRQVKPEAGA